MSVWQLKTSIDRVTVSILSHTQVLLGASDSSLLVTNLLVTVIRTRFLRFYPKSWVGGIAMKVEVFADKAGNELKTFRLKLFVCLFFFIEKHPIIFHL